MRSVKIAFVFALTCIGIAIVAVLANTPLVVAGTNLVHAPIFRNGTVSGDTASCQPGGTIPRGTSAIRVSLGANSDPRIEIKVFSGSRLVTQGTRGPGGGIDASATIPVKQVADTIRDSRICVTLGPSAELIGIRGVLLQPAADGIDVRLRMEYMRAGARSWWSLASAVAYRFGLGRAAAGTWIAFLALALALATVALATRLVLRDLR